MFTGKRHPLVYTTVFGCFRHENQQAQRRPQPPFAGLAGYRFAIKRSQKCDRQRNRYFLTPFMLRSGYCRDNKKAVRLWRQISSSRDQLGSTPQRDHT